MNNSLLYYSVGALLYSPANNETIVDSIINHKFGTKYSLALCLEDTIRDDCVEEAENKLIDSINRLYMHTTQKEFYLPKIFIRVRAPQQISALHKALGENAALISGLIAVPSETKNMTKIISADPDIEDSVLNGRKLVFERIQNVVSAPQINDAGTFINRHRVDGIFGMLVDFDDFLYIVICIFNRKFRQNKSTDQCGIFAQSFM